MPDVAAALVREGVLTPDAVTRALDAARDGDVASAALRLGLAPEAALVRVLARLEGFPGIDLSRSVVPASNLRLVPPNRCRERGVLPVWIGEREVVLAMVDPRDRAALNEFRLLAGRRVLPYVAVRAAIYQVLYALVRGQIPVWRGPGAPALPDPEAAWVGVVRGVEPVESVELPDVDEGMELISVAETMPSVQQVAGRRGQARAVQPKGTSARVEPSRAAAPPEAPPPASARPAVPAGEPARSLAASPPDPSAAPPPAAAPARRARPLAVVADDDPELRKLMGLVLAYIGLDMVEAEDGNAALALVRERRPALLVLDAMMPGLHGFDVCAAVRRDPLLGDTRVVFCSAVYRGIVADDARLAFGADGFIQKPFRLEEAAATLRTVLEGPPDAEADGAAIEAAAAAWRAAAAALKAGRDEEALSLCRRAVAQDPLSSEAQYWLGHALSRQGLLFEAVAAFERASELRPEVGVVHQCLALTYERLGFQRAARQAWAHAIAACDDARRKQAMQARLEKLLFL
jgi:CheY-like chemotaxis protein